MKLVKTLLIIPMFSLFIVACGDNKQDNSALLLDKPSSQIKIKVGSEGAYKPFSYVEKDGTITGYDVEVLRLLQEIDPSLEFEFNYAPWNSLFLGLDSGRFDVLANQIIKTQEREERYLFNQVNYFVSTSQFITRKDSNINTIQDFKGKTLGGLVGSAHTKIAQDWNKENGNILNIKYYKDLMPLLQDLVNKRIDLHLNDPASIVDIVKTQGLELKILDIRAHKSDVFFIFKKEEKYQIIADKIDAALIIAKDSGKLSALSIKFFGIDQSK